VIRDNADVYLTESIAGRPVQFSDDSMLTLFALRRGRAVQAEDCFAFTYMPATLDHHVRQQLRWMRGSFIRSIWRFRYLPMRSPASWLHLVKWLMYGLATGTLVHLAVEGHLTNAETVLTGLFAAVALHVSSTLRYLLVHRTDQSVPQRLITFATAPAAAF
jgi:hyaluronan synthase